MCYDTYIGGHNCLNMAKIAQNVIFYSYKQISTLYIATKASYYSCNIWNESWAWKAHSIYELMNYVV